jgi:hypothetical protein
LDFGKEEVYLLLLQASWQAGPSALQQVSRDSHSELEKEGFGQDLLSALVVKLLHDSSNEGEMAYLTLRALDLALICHCTFDIDPRQLPSLLSSADNVTILIETATTVNDRWPVLEGSLITLTRELLQRFSRTSHALEPDLKKRIVASQTE